MPERLECEVLQNSTTQIHLPLSLPLRYLSSRSLFGCFLVLQWTFVIAGVRILGHFARIPFHYCSRLPNIKIPQQLAAGKLKGMQTAQI